MSHIVTASHLYLKFKQEKINLHLDTCLLQDKATDTKEENMKSQKKLNGDEDMFDDFDDDMLMEAADAAEKSLISIHSNRSVVFFSVDPRL